MKSIIIFGANCQDGYYLAELYRKRGDEVLGVSRSGAFLKGDVGSFKLVEKLVRNHKPDIIFHLAATSSTSHEALFENHKTIGTGGLNILEAVYRWHPKCRVFLTGSGLQFVNTGNPIHETDPFDASNAYSVERIHTAYAARYFRSLGVSVFVGYLFHHESPKRKPVHISQHIVQSVKRIVAGSSEKLELFDISVEKEWAFAGDIANAMAILAEQESVYEAVIGTGKPYTIEDWLNICFSSVGVDWKKHVVLREGFTSKYKRLVSNPQTMLSLGWYPKIDIVELANLMLSS
jgi:GDPmannose 4,6-dehydratase